MGLGSSQCNVYACGLVGQYLVAANIRKFVDPQNPTRVAVLMDVPDMDAFKAAMQTKAATDAMASDGVVPESLVVLVES